MSGTERPDCSGCAPRDGCSSPPAGTMARNTHRQQQRLLAQLGFFTLFLLAPVFDLFRYDLQAGHAWLLGQPWQLGFDDYLAGQIGSLDMAGRLMLRLFLPLLLGAALFLYFAWRWGRLYCGWLCPHFSVVETINTLMRKASGKPSVWERNRLPPWHADGRPWQPDARWWLLVVPAALGFALLWAVVLLTYLLPPAQVYGGLLDGSLSRGPILFITAATVVLSLEFLFARHLFCRYACAVGLFQSLAWMANRSALVVGFQRVRAADCATCLPDRAAACEAACPMRLNPRMLKRHMFTCTQCAQCISACAESQQHNPQGPLLQWVTEEAARQNEASFLGARPSRRPQEHAPERTEGLTPDKRIIPWKKP